MSQNSVEQKTKRISTWPTLLFCLLCTASVLLFPSLVSKSIRHSCERFYSRLLPALFPMMILSRRILACFPTPKGKISRGFCRLFSLSCEEIPLFLTGLLCGYPLPAALSAQMYEDGRLSAKDAERCAALFDNASPGFLIAFIGSGLLGSVKYGIFLYISQILSVLCAAKLFDRPEKGVSVIGKTPSAPLTDDIKNAAKLLSEIAAFTAAFSLAADFIRAALLKIRIPLPIAALVSGLFEVTNGCALLVDGRVPKSLLCVLLPFLAGMGGASVLFQVRAALPRACSIRSYLAVRPVIAVLMTACFRIMVAVSP